MNSTTVPDGDIELGQKAQNPTEETCVGLLNESTNEIPSNGSQQSSSSNLRQRIKALITVLTGIFVIFSIYSGIKDLAVTTNDSKDSVKIDCTGDIFIGENITGDFIKYYIANLENETVSYERAQKICTSLDSTLWEVKNKAEWETLFERSKSEDVVEMWLGGKFAGECEQDKLCNDEADRSTSEDVDEMWLSGKFVGECEQDKLCKDESDRGNGYSVIWNSTGLSSEYSRLFECDSELEENDRCIYVQQNLNNLWATSNCEEDEKYFICIKRNCNVEH